MDIHEVSDVTDAIAHGEEPIPDDLLEAAEEFQRVRNEFDSIGASILDVRRMREKLDEEEVFLYEQRGDVEKHLKYLAENRADIYNWVAHVFDQHEEWDEVRFNEIGPND